MFRVFQLFSVMSRWERWVLGVLTVAFLLSLTGLLRRFYFENTIIVPSTGGSYIEGSVGDLQPLNPWFIVQNDVNRDIVSLVFSGLMRYNPQTRAIEEDLATMTVSKDGRTYTLRLKDDIQWHDSTPSNPHPVTADDVLFTFQTIQDPDFPNLLLQQNFRGVTIEKIDDRTVRFRLEEPYSFFSSNLTLGLLPRSAFEGVTPGKMDQVLDFGFHPVGAGPYRVKTIVQTDLSSEVTLERFTRPLSPVYRLDRVVFRIFPDYSSLLSDLRNLHGVRLVARNDKGEPILPKQFTARTYYLPQYVALFFNLSRPVLQDETLRLGLQLGTDKQNIVDDIHESVIVDTPLLQIDISDWRYHFDPDAAQGALLASKWNLPERVRLQKVLEQEEANDAGFLRLPDVVDVREGRTLTFSGAYVAEPKVARVNGVPVVRSQTNSGQWIVRLPMLSGTGAIQPGENLLRVTDDKGKILDSFYLMGARTAAEGRRLREERRLALLFKQSKAGPQADKARITIGNLFLEDGILRLRTSGDPYSIRQNEKGEPLTLHLLTSLAPPAYHSVAEKIREQWETLGVRVIIDTPSSPQDFENRLLRRDYDILLFGQSLLDNLDSFPYWHSSGLQRLTGQDKDLRRDAYNLSQYSSFAADTLLETIRSTADEKERQKALSGLRDLLKKETPAIFLYSPLYAFAHRNNILGIELGALSLHSDRFLSLYKWYIKEDRVFRPGWGWGSFLGWLPTLL